VHFSDLGYFVLVFFAFVVLGFVSSVLRQEIGWEERLWNDLFSVEWDVNVNVSTNFYSALVAHESEVLRCKTLTQSVVIIIAATTSYLLMIVFRVTSCPVGSFLHLLLDENHYSRQLECGPMPNVMAALPNIGGALCSTPQSFADTHY